MPILTSTILPMSGLSPGRTCAASRLMPRQASRATSCSADSLGWPSVLSAVLQRDWADPEESAEQLVARLAWRGISGWPRTSDQG